MKLSHLEKNQRGIIKSINCPLELKQRFYSFGIIKGSHIEIENTSLNKNTIEINIENTSIALRVEEADFIEVELV